MKPEPPLPNEDEDFAPEEIEAAAGKTPAGRSPPELEARTKDLTEWDEPPASTGIAAPKVLPEDEASIAEELVDEGVEEAERERRLAAADPDFEP